MLCTKQLFLHFHLDKAAKWIKYFRKLIHHKISVILQKRIKCLELGDQEGGTRKIFKKKKNKEKTIQTDQEKNKYKRGKREANRGKLVFCDI